ncbi:MAG: hypothetical protein GXP62_13400 [Oligoflexia bacterium]|nr:hypothetical protein [Oligoflexia bacterium]
MRAVLVLPHLSPETIARGLVECAPQRDTLVAVLLPLPQANATAVIFADLAGQALALDLDPMAQALSAGGTEIGVAIGHSDDPARRFVGYRDGRVLHTLGPDDELFLPVDEDGFPDMERPPVRRVDGPPDGWGRFRSCHDLGMKRAFSCRFGPVEHCLDKMVSGQDVGARAYALVRDHHRLRPPLALPWDRTGHPRSS